MIDNSALRVLREYHSQPQLQGEIVLTLADLYAALQDAAGASALLEDSCGRQGLTRISPLWPMRARNWPTTNCCKGHGRAAELVSQAEAFWNLQPRRYAEERLEGSPSRRECSAYRVISRSGRNRDCGHLAADRAFRPHPP